MKTKKFFVTLLVLSVTFRGITQEPILLDAEEYSQKISLQGKIILRDFYGHPNYGEDPQRDKKESYYCLLLDEPQNILYENSIIQTKELQLIFESHIETTHFSSNSLYKVTGYLFLAMTGHHHTPVLMKIENIIELSEILAN